MYFIVLYLFLFCLLFPLVSSYFFHETNTFRDTQIDKAVKARTKSLADKATYLTRLISYNSSQSISEYNFSFLNNVIEETVNGDDDLIGCRLLANKNIGSINVGLGKGALELQPLIMSTWRKRKAFLGFPEEIPVNQPLPVAQLKIDNPEPDAPQLLLFIAPIYVGDTLWGTVNSIFSPKNLNIDTKKIENDWLKQMRNYKVSLFTFACLFVILGGGFAYIFTRPLLRSLYLLKDGVNLVANGDLDFRINENQMNIMEVLSLSKSFNAMTENLQNNRRQLDDYSHSLEEKVEERTAELIKAQKKLLSQAHEAGMAEMAVGVLHNIGNAITPAKVRASLLVKDLLDSPLRKNLATFLSPLKQMVEETQTGDRKKQENLLKVISLLPESIKEEYDQSIEALNTIVTKHDYIEGIINLQMRYAKIQDTTATSEIVEVNRILQDAVKMMEDLVSKNNINVITDFQDVSSVLIEENKLLQILVNLIKNSCEAMEEKSGREKNLYLSTAQKDGVNEEVVISVRDTGYGIKKEDMANLFTFGYSTKERSSGFGLHSSANYLIANNGRIEALSEGPGFGAEFIIRLQPVKKEKVV